MLYPGKLFLLNLDASQDRLAFMDQQFADLSLKYQRISAVDGRTLAQAEIDKIYHAKLNAKQFYQPLNKGEIGCYLSHRKCWQKIVDEQLAWAVILEDDCVLNPNLAKIIHMMSVDEPLKNWDYLKLTYLKPGCKLTASAALPHLDNFTLVDFYKVPITTKAQIVSFQGAKKLLAATKQIGRPIDVDIQNYWQLNIRVLGLLPAAIDAQENFSSEIKKCDSAQPTKKNIKRLLKRLKYQFFYLLKLKHYRAKQSQITEHIK